MKIKNLETAKKYGFKLLISESELIDEVAAWRDDFTPEEFEDFKKNFRDKQRNNAGKYSCS